MLSLIQNIKNPFIYVVFNLECLTMKKLNVHYVRNSFNIYYLVSDPMSLVLVTLLATFAGILWTLLIFPFRILGMKLYKITDRPIISIISKGIINKSCILQDGENPIGFFFSWTYFGYVHLTETERGSSTQIYLLATDKRYKSLTSNKDEAIKSDDKTYKLYTRKGNYFWLDYSTRTVSTSIKPSEKQQLIMDQIKEIQKQSLNNTCAIYLHGAPGKGKSTIPILLATDTNASLCKSFNPADPGDNLDLIYNKVLPTAKSPLIIVLEEVDILINKIVNGVQPHKDIPISVQNKTQWNTFFDDLKMLYPNLILILTSNVSPEQIDRLDSSYLRSGRIDGKISLN